MKTNHLTPAVSSEVPICRDSPRASPLVFFTKNTPPTLGRGRMGRGELDQIYFFLGDSGIDYDVIRIDLRGVNGLFQFVCVVF